METTRNYALDATKSNNLLKAKDRQRRIETLIMKRKKSQLPYNKEFLQSQLYPVLRDIGVYYDNTEILMRIERLWITKEQENDKITRKNCSLTIQEDPKIGLPKFVVILYCEGCHNYSYRGRSIWQKLNPKSLPLLEFLVGRISFHIRRLQLTLITAWFVEESHTTSIPVALKLQSTTADGSRHENVFTVMFKLDYLNCPRCSHLLDETELNTVLQLKHYDSCYNQSLCLLELRVLEKGPSYFKIKKIMHTKHGVDYFFANDKDAKALFEFLGARAPIKRFHIYKSNAICQSYITTVVCPISEGSLVFLPAKVSATLGVHQYLGPLVICTGVSSAISFLDPLNLKECRMRDYEYWREPFEPLEVSRKLVEYIVLDMEIVSSGLRFSLANARVARVSDFGKNDTVFVVKTHLGNILKPGDYVLGCDLCGARFTDVEMMNCKDKLPDVVFIKKKYVASKLPIMVPKKNTSPEYEQFLVELEDNPEAMFNFSLNGGDDGGEKQNSEMASVKPENSGSDLEDLLAHLDLNDQVTNL